MLRRVPWLAVVLWGLGCASQSAQGPRPRSEFTADDAKSFEDGADLIEDPDQLEGQWRLDWDRDLDRRIAQSDLIVLGTVTTLRAETDLEHHTSYQIVLGIERALEGDKPKGELTLTSREGASGYSSVVEHHDRFLNRQLVAFLKYAAGPEGGPVIAHFHLSVPSKVVLERVAAYDAKKRPTSVQIVERRE